MIYFIKKRGSVLSMFSKENYTDFVSSFYINNIMNERLSLLCGSMQISYITKLWVFTYSKHKKYVRFIEATLVL